MTSAKAKAQAKPERRGRPLLGGLILLCGLIVAILLAEVLFGRFSASATYKVSLRGGQFWTEPDGGWPVGGGVAIVRPSEVRVFFQVKNTSTVSGSPTCTIRVHSPGDDHVGKDAVTFTNIGPGKTKPGADAVSVGGNYASQINHVSISCS
jgi:hypothetical protein